MPARQRMSVLLSHDSIDTFVEVVNCCLCERFENNMQLEYIILIYFLWPTNYFISETTGIRFQTFHHRKKKPKEKKWNIIIVTVCRFVSKNSRRFFESFCDCDFLGKEFILEIKSSIISSSLWTVHLLCWVCGGFLFSQQSVHLCHIFGVFSVSHQQWETFEVFKYILYAINCLSTTIMFGWNSRINYNVWLKLENCILFFEFSFLLLPTNRTRFSHRSIN